MKSNQEKTTYGRLRVLTAPPTSVHEIGGGAALGANTASETASPREMEGSPFCFDAKSGGTGNDGAGGRRNVTSSGSTTPANASSGRRSNLRPSSGTGSTQRLSGGNRDHSVTQFAVIDDENVSALQQVFFFCLNQLARPNSIVICAF